MLPARAQWKTYSGEQEAIDRLQEALQISPLAASLLSARGYTDQEKATRFLYPDESFYLDPFGLVDMDRAVARIQQAVQQQEKILIYGDYDADGISSTVLMIRLMEQLQAVYETYIPHRTKEGYGLNKRALERAAEHGVKLIVTVDNGISAVDEIAYASELGIDVVVTDHHEPPEQLPEAWAIVNPKRKDCPYVFKSLAGVGVAFKLAHACLDRMPVEWLDVVTIGTIADLMPLVDENRWLVKQGLERIRHFSGIGLRALLQVAGVEPEQTTETNVAFGLAPRINASGRMQHADLAVRLLTAEHEQGALELAYQLDQLNKERQQLVEVIVEEALQQLVDVEIPPVIVVHGEGWNVGVVGIVASKLVERYYRPVVVLSTDPDTGLSKGSARSIEGYDLHAALVQADQWLTHYGGHQAAAGMTLQTIHIPQLVTSLCDCAAQWLSDEDYVPKLHADGTCELPEVTLEAIAELAELGPFGAGNPPPRFVIGDVSVAGIRLMGKDERHMKLILSMPAESGGKTLEAVGFGMGKLRTVISDAAKVNLFGELSVNEWNGIRKPQLFIEDLSISSRQVFDWRGKQSAKPRIEALVQLQGELTRLSADKPAFLVDENDRARWERSSYPVWAYPSSGMPILPLNEVARSRSFAESRDIIMFHLPPGESVLAEALGQAQHAERFYALFQRPPHDPGLPNRDIFKHLYGELRKQRRLSLQDRISCDRLARALQIDLDKLKLMLLVFEELGFIEIRDQEVICAERPQHRELQQSRAYAESEARQMLDNKLTFFTTEELSQWILEQAAHTQPERVQV